MARVLSLLLSSVIRARLAASCELDHERIGWHEVWEGECWKVKCQAQCKMPNMNVTNF